jgi:putative redox protein
MQILHVEKYQHEATSRGHSVIADEPKDAGGDDQGMTPYELLLAALGTCTAMTLRMYAERKGWDLQDVRVDLEHDRVHADDCEECETGEGKLSRLRRKVEVTGDLDDEQRARLHEIANRCPVHRTLEGPIEIFDVDEF